MGGELDKTGAQLVIEGLVAHGVDTVFGIPGIHSMPLYDAMYDHQAALRFISTRHEHAAVLMADGHARVTGRPGVALTTTGPGAANTMGGMGEAFHSSSRILHITTTAAEQLYGRGLGTGHETRDQLGMFAGVTSWRAHVGDPVQIPDAMEEAFVRLAHGRPRPVVLEIACDVLARRTSARTPTPRLGDPAKVTLDAEALRRCAKLLASGRVAVWVGGGISCSGASEALLELAQALRAPVLTTAKGKDGFPYDHPLCLGVFDGGGDGSALPPFDGAPNPLPSFVAGLDALLVVGSSLAYSRTRAHGVQLPATLVQVDVDPEVLGKTYEPTVAIVADAGAALEAITAALARVSIERPPEWEDQLAQIRDQRTAHLRARHPEPFETMALIRSIAPRDAIFTVDPTLPVFHGSHPLLATYVPRSYLVPRWSGIGFAFAAAAGAKVARPERAVICLVGDGGFQCHVQELATCMEHGIAVVILVFNDNGWGILRQHQRSRYGGRVLGTDLHNPDFPQLAAAYGATGVRVSSRAELGRAMHEALGSSALTLIEVAIHQGWESFH